MPATADLLAFWLLLCPPVPAADNELPDKAMLEFLATFASEDGQLDDPASLEELEMPTKPAAETGKKPMPASHEPVTEKTPR